jgi:hypothetical protein
MRVCLLPAISNRLPTQLHNNCYDFVIRFAGLLQAGPAPTKEVLAAQLIQPRLTLLECFLAIARRVHLDGKYEGKFEVGASSTSFFFRELRKCDCSSSAVPEGRLIGAWPLLGRPSWTCDTCDRRRLAATDHFRCLLCDDFDQCRDCHSAQRTTPAHPAWHPMISEDDPALDKCSACSRTGLASGQRFLCIECPDSAVVCSNCQSAAGAVPLPSPHTTAHKTRLV